MRTLLLSCLLALTVGSQAQTYYYVNSIGVSPAAPTTADPVTVTLFGDLSASNSFIVGTSFNIVGSQVQLTVNAASQGIGLPMLVPHDESFNLGTLAAGTYTITIGGANVGDFAPGPQHQFTVVGGGGSPCDSLTLSPLTWHPFTDTALLLSASNASSTLFDYPGFILFNDQGDTLAQETVNYFGIGLGPQPHILSIHPGATIPSGSFFGQLELWTLFYQALGCTWTDTLDLCPPAPCAPLTVSIGNFGGAIVTSSFSYSVTDGNGTTVGSGTLILDPLNQSDSAVLCLQPGDYTLSMVQPNITGGQLSIGVGTDVIAGPQQPFTQGGAPNVMPFSFYPACFNGPNGLAEIGGEQALTCTLNNNMLTIRRDDGRALGPITLSDAQGRMISATSGTSNTLTLDVSTLPEGLLIVQGTTAEGVRTVARVMNVR